MKPSTYWWNVQTDPHEMVFDTVEQLTENQKYRKRDNFNHARLYGNAFLSDLQNSMTMVNLLRMKKENPFLSRSFQSIQALF